MSNLTVYSKTGDSFFTIKEYAFQSDFMGEKKITATVYDPDKLDFEIGAYVVYKNEKFSIFNNTRSTKTARTSENIGDAMQYDLEFFSPSKILETINFEDYVSKDDTQQYYTGTSVFYFYNNVTELAVRIQANLDRFVGAGVWSVLVDDGVILEEMQISANNNNLLEALNFAQNYYGLNYYISGTSIQIGGSGSEINQTFFYGKGKGLYEIARAFESDSDVITRLKVYGAEERNLPSDYLRDENAKGRYFTQLMLPNFATTQIDYVDAPAEMIAEYGIREGVKTFDDIYPSIEEVDLGGGRIDEIVSVAAIDLDSDYFTIKTRDLGFDINDYLTAETARISIKSGNADGTPTYLGGYEFEITQVSGNYVTLLKNQADSNILPDDVTTVRAGDRFVLLGIEMPQSYITNAENKLKERAEAYFTEDGGIELSYLIKPDPKFIKENVLEDVFISGDRIKIEDDDLDVANYFTIQNVSIKYGSDVLPEYDVKLSNIKAATLKEELVRTKETQSTVNAFINKSTTNTRISNNLRIDNVGADLTWQ